MEHPEITGFVHFDHETAIAAVEEISDGERKQEIESMIAVIGNDDVKPEVDEGYSRLRKDGTRKRHHWSHNEWHNLCPEGSDGTPVDTYRVLHRKPKKRLFAHRLQWSNDNMENAMTDVRERNMTLRGAAKKNGVPYSTLKDRIQGRVMHGTKPGVKTVLSPEEENDLVLCIQQMQAGGFALHCANIRELARQMLMMRVMRGFSMPYRDGCPGHNWLAGFLKRHPGIHLKRTSNRNMVLSASKQKQILKKFFEITSHMYKKYRLLQKPESIFVVTELKISAYPRASAYIACNARGVALSPFVQFHSDPVNASRLSAYSLPEYKDALFFNAKGAHDGDALFVWFRDHFLQCRASHHSSPMTLFIGCPVSEISLRLVQLAEEERVALVAVPGAVAHLVQPLSSAILRCLNAAVSGGFDQLLSVENLARSSSASHSLLALSLAKTWASQWPGDDVRDAFASCGIYPLNVRAISAERIAATSISDDVSDCYTTNDSADDIGDDDDDDDDVTHGLNLLSELSTLEQQKESSNERFNAEDLQHSYEDVTADVSDAAGDASAYASTSADSLHNRAQQRKAKVHRKKVPKSVINEDDRSDETSTDVYAGLSFSQSNFCPSSVTDIDQFERTQASLIVGGCHSVHDTQQRLIPPTDRVKLSSYAGSMTRRSVRDRTLSHCENSLSVNNRQWMSVHSENNSGCSAATGISRKAAAGELTAVDDLMQKANSLPQINAHKSGEDNSALQVIYCPSVSSGMPINNMEQDGGDRTESAQIEAPVVNVAAGCDNDEDSYQNVCYEVIILS